MRGHGEQGGNCMRNMNRSGSWGVPGSGSRGNEPQALFSTAVTVTGEKRNAKCQDAKFPEGRVSRERGVGGGAA